MERREAWSAGPGVFCVLARAECSSTRQMPDTISRGMEGSAYVRDHIAALWPTGGDCRPGHPGDTIAPPLCHPARPGWPASRLCPGPSQHYAQSRAHPGALFAAADLLLGLADPLARIPREPAPDLAAFSGPGPGDHARHRR